MIGTVSSSPAVPERHAFEHVDVNNNSFAVHLGIPRMGKRFL